MDFLNDLNTFATENRWIFWPVVGMIVTIISQIRRIGFRKLKQKKHPFKTVLAMVVFGVVIGLFMAWLTTVLRH